MSSDLRLADLLAGLSVVSDLGFSLPPEEAMRRCVLATALARRMGLAEPQVADVYWTALLQHVGCTAFAHETAAAYGDEMTLNAAVAPLDPGNPAEAVAFLRAATAGLPLPARLARAAYTVVAGGRFGQRFATATCEVGRETARRLGLGDGVRLGLQDAVEDWNGKGGARGLRGEQISLPARITAVAFTATLFESVAEGDVTRVLRRRAGRLLDPEIVEAFVRHQPAIRDELRDQDPRDAVLAAEPTPPRTVRPDRLPEVAAAIGDVADLKSPFFHGHSAGVAELATRAAATLAMGDEARRRLQVAARLHDVGRVAVPTATWERPGPLTQAQWEQVRLHAYHSERVLARSTTLQPMARLAGAHHERLDGSGYHRGADARDIPLEARLLAAADALEAMSHDRPYRPALGSDEAVARLAEEVRAHRLDAAAVDAVVAAHGQSPGTPVRSRWPKGLSEREVEVLRLVAGGLSNPQIAQRLVISRRTAEHHVQHIYDKLGVSSRAAAALFAMEHHLLE